MTPIDTDRTLLYGVVAVQNRLIHRKILAAALNVWVGDKSKPLGQILIEHGSLAKHQHATLESLVDAQLRGHDDDPIQGLTASSALWTVREDVQALGDPDLDQVMDRVMARCCEDVESVGSGSAALEAPNAVPEEGSAPPAKSDSETEQGAPPPDSGREAQAALASPEASVAHLETAIKTEAKAETGASAEARAELAALGAATVAHTATEAPESQYLTLRQMLLRATKSAKPDVDAAAKPATASSPSLASASGPSPRPAEAAAPFNEFVKALALDAFAARARGAGSNFDAVIPSAQAQVQVRTQSQPETESNANAESGSDQPSPTDAIADERQAESTAIPQDARTLPPAADPEGVADANDELEPAPDTEAESGPEVIGEIQAVTAESGSEPAPESEPDAESQSQSQSQGPTDTEVDISSIDSPSAPSTDAASAVDSVGDSEAVDERDVIDEASGANEKAETETPALASAEASAGSRPLSVAKSSFPFAQRLAEQANLAPSARASEAEPRDESNEPLVSTIPQSADAVTSSVESGSAVVRTGESGGAGWLRILGSMAAGAGLTAGLMSYWGGS